VRPRPPRSVRDAASLENTHALDDDRALICNIRHSTVHDSVSALLDQHPWYPAEGPWQCVYLDLAGPMDNMEFLVAFDTYSKWPEIFPMQKGTMSATITVLRSLFARQWLPPVVVTDNGPQFRSAEFQAFMQSNGINHFRCILPLYTFSGTGAAVDLPPL